MRQVVVGGRKLMSIRLQLATLLYTFDGQENTNKGKQYETMMLCKLHHWLPKQVNV
jgi:hypothetical protein